MDIKSLVLLDSVMDDYEGFPELYEIFSKAFPEIGYRAMPHRLLDALSQLRDAGLVELYGVDADGNLARYGASVEPDQLAGFYYYRSEAGKQIWEAKEVHARLDEFYAKGKSADFEES